MSLKSITYPSMKRTFCSRGKRNHATHQSLSSHFPHLEEFSLRKVTSEFVDSMVESPNFCTKLKALLIEDSGDITFLNSLHKCTNLCHLKLRTSLTDAQCTAMAQSLTKLTALAICTNEEASAIINQVTSLFFQALTHLMMII